MRTHAHISCCKDSMLLLFCLRIRLLYFWNLFSINPDISLICTHFISLIKFFSFSSSRFLRSNSIHHLVSHHESHLSVRKQTFCRVLALFVPWQVPSHPFVCSKSHCAVIVCKRVCAQVLSNWILNFLTVLLLFFLVHRLILLHPDQLLVQLRRFSHCVLHSLPALIHTLLVLAALTTITRRLRKRSTRSNCPKPTLHSP